MHSDYFYAADDALHSARKFTHFWGADDDRKYAARHAHQAVLCALKGHAEIMGCQFPLAATRRSAILLISGDKTGDDRWYDVNIPIADGLYDEHLVQLRKEGLIDG